MINLAEWIRKAGKEQRVVEFQCPYVPEFYVRIAYASKSLLQQIRDAAKEIVSNLRSRDKTERLNEDKLYHEYATRIILGWRGLTAEKMKKIVPGIKIEADIDPVKEISYDPEVAKALLEVSVEFENWALGVAMDIENYSKIGEQKSKEYENLS